jgi:hypothetical protein
MNRLSLLAALAVAATAVSACGEGSTTSSSGKVSPTQYSNAQRIGGYVVALNKIEEPFRHPPTEPTNYAKGSQLLRTAIAALSALTPPPQLEASYRKILDGSRGELATFPDFERGQRTHNAVTISNAEAKNVRAEAVVRAGLAEGGAVLSNCQRANFSC